MSVLKVCSVFGALLALASPGYGVDILAPGDVVFGGQRDVVNFNVGGEGFDADTNNWPGPEGPDHAIDGVGQKYLNFGKLNTGIVVTPAVGSSVAKSLKLWTANDAVPRDPASYQLWGTNSVLGAGPFAISDFSPISTGDLALPDTRNAGGASALLDQNSQTINFANSLAFTSYMVVFPTVKDAGGANSMQIGEIQLMGIVPAPGAVSVALLGLGGCVVRRRR